MRHAQADHPGPVTIDAAQLAGIIRTEVRAALAELTGEAPTPSRQFNFERLAYFDAALESGRYLTSHLVGATDLVTAEAVRAHAIALAPAGGLVLEFGVFDGRSLKQIAAAVSGEVHGFDSFEGLPEDWTHFQKRGRFSLGGVPPIIDSPNVRLHKGWFDESLPRFLATHPGMARFIHVDCDLYQSASTVLTLLADRIGPATVIVFDEYLNYPGWQQHEHKAFAEFIARTGRRYRYLGFASAEFAVSVQIQ